jgi:hypothetical protein
VSLYALLSTTVTTDPNPDKVTPGFAGFSVIFLLAVATIVLIRSMTRHLRNVRYSPDPGDQVESGRPGEPVPSGGAALEGHGHRAGNVVDDQGIHSGRE